MKNNNNKNKFDWYGLSQHFSIRKYHFGVASVLLGTSLLTNPVGVVSADEVATVVSQPESFNLQLQQKHKYQQQKELLLNGQVQTTTWVSSSALENAVNEAKQAGVEVTETIPRQQSSVSAAIADSVAQIKEVNAAITAQKGADAIYAQKQAEYETAVKANAEAVANKAVVDAHNAEQKAAYEQAKAEYGAEKKVYDDTLAAAKAAEATNDKIKADNASMKTKYDAAKAVYDKEHVEFVAAKAAYDTAVAAKEKVEAHNIQIETDNAQAQAAYDKAMAKYQADLTQYKADLAAYSEAVKSRTIAEAKNAAVSEANAKVQADYEVAKAAYETEKGRYNKDLKDYNDAVAKKAEVEAHNTQIESDNAQAQIDYENAVKAHEVAKAEYKEALDAFNKAVAAKAAAEATNANITKGNHVVWDAYNADKAEYDAKKASYDVARAKYEAEKAQYDQAKEAFDAAKTAYEQALSKYEIDYNHYLEDLKARSNNGLKYASELAKYELAKKQYDEAKAAYNEYLASANLQNIVQDLTFLRESNATHTTTGIDMWLKREAQARLGSGGTVAQYRTDQMTATDTESNNPYKNQGESEWAVVKEGQKFDVIYENLSGSKLGGKTISKVVYKYEIVKLPSADGVGIAQIHQDPTLTMTIGSATDNDKPVHVNVDVEFYDENGNKIDWANKSAIFALNSLNHWDGSPYVEASKPRVLTVEAKDTENNVVRGTWDPYADGSSPQSADDQPIKKYGSVADIVWENGAKVTINDSNPLKLVTAKSEWKDNSFQVTEQKTVTETSLNASGSANGKSIGADTYVWNDNGVEKNDVLGTYKIDPTTGSLVYTPKVIFQTTRHQEYVGIGDQEYILMPRSSVSFDSATNQVTSQKSNQYTSQGSVYNANANAVTSSEGWDNPASTIFYYGGAGVKMITGHLEFIAKGANATGDATVYWFAINSNLAFPKDPGEEPTPPIPPTDPVEPEKPSFDETEPTAPTEPTPPTPPAKPISKPEVEVPEVPIPPVEPAPPSPVTPTPKLDIPEVPDRPTPPIPPAEPRYKPKVEVPEVPAIPREPTPPSPVTTTPKLEVPKVPSEPTPPTPPVEPIYRPEVGIPEVPSNPIPPAEPNYKLEIEVPEVPVSPERQQFYVKWHKNFVVELSEKLLPPANSSLPVEPEVDIPEVSGESTPPVMTEKPNTAIPVKSVTPAQKVLPETGASYGVPLFMAGMTAFTAATLLAVTKCKED
ncbi:GbpC/Spa domain-containing protein [Streptococcus marmotae]|uniref:GbpC/Spa domain-containing protein n=1 Tax=Streptococcus marmotae TaxID=1825069 RepID=UPI00082EF0A0|nr:GbpC/Spa domain-containing protein [Streptococcus marmotae]